MLSHNEFVIWTIDNKTKRIAIGICNNVDSPIVYLKDQVIFKEGIYNCYSFYEAALTMEEAKEIIEMAKISNNRAVPKLIKRYVKLSSSLSFYEDIGYSQLTDMVSDDWFDSVKWVLHLLDNDRYKGHYEYDVEVTTFSEESIEIL